MSEAAFRVCALAPEHDRRAFASGSAALDRYLQQQVTQDLRRRMTACFVALDDHGHIAGYYTLAAASMLLNELPATLARRLPRYPSVPAVRLGRLAVAQAFQHQGLGGALLADALLRAANSDIAAYALVVDALDAQAVAFYRHHGFIALPEAAQTLFLPLAMVSRVR